MNTVRVPSATGWSSSTEPKVSALSGDHPSRGPAEDLRHEASFLLARLRDFEADGINDDNARDWFGHVQPSMERLQGLCTSPAFAAAMPSGEDIFGDFDEADYKPDLASAIAAEIMGLKWTHALPTGDDIQDEIDAQGEHCNRYGDVQEVVNAVLERSRTETHTTRITGALAGEARSAETQSGSVEDEHAADLSATPEDLASIRSELKAVREERDRALDLADNWKATAAAEAEIGNERAAEASHLRERVEKLEEALKLITLQYMGAGGNLRPEEVQLAMEQIARAALSSSQTETRDEG